MLPQEMILWEDAALLAVNKPAGLLSIRDGYNPQLPYLSKLIEEDYGRIWVVHRLDKDTSGVILFARSEEAHRQLNRQFEQRVTRKVYHALVVGQPKWDSLTVSLPLRVNGDRRHRTVIDAARGKPAETDLRVLQQYSGYALVEAQPHSGYTHQIRAHLAAVGMPLVADALYKSLMAVNAETNAKPAAPSSIQRTALHAAQISFCHPVRQESITIQASYPEDFLKALQELAEDQSAG